MRRPMGDLQFLSASMVVVDQTRKYQAAMMLLHEILNELLPTGRFDFRRSDIRRSERGNHGKTPVLSQRLAEKLK